MRPPGKQRYKLHQLMLVIAVFAFSLALPRLLISQRDLVAISILGALVGIVAISVLVDVLPVKPCPACSRRALRRLARHRNYYCCSACRARFKRFGAGPWLDASGPNDAVRYGRLTEAGIWKEFVAPENLEGSTSGFLLGRKRIRELPAIAPRVTPQAVPARWHQEAQRKIRRFFSRLEHTDE